MPTAGNLQRTPLPSQSGTGPAGHPGRKSGVPAARPSRLVVAAHAVVSSPIVAALGWLALLVPAYWSLVDEHGQWLLKLDSFVYYGAVRQ